MLVLSRRNEEKVVFPTLGISLQVLQIRANQVKLGIDAPPSVKVLRQELNAGWQSPARADVFSGIHQSLGRLEKEWVLGKTDEAAHALAELNDALARLGLRHEPVLYTMV